MLIPYDSAYSDAFQSAVKLSPLFDSCNPVGTAGTGSGVAVGAGVGVFVGVGVGGGL